MVDVVEEVEVDVVEEVDGGVVVDVVDVETVPDPGEVVQV